jgi:hypothetical protein
LQEIPRPKRRPKICVSLRYILNINDERHLPVIPDRHRGAVKTGFHRRLIGPVIINMTKHDENLLSSYIMNRLGYCYGFAGFLSSK